MFSMQLRFVQLRSALAQLKHALAEWVSQLHFKKLVNVYHGVASKNKYYLIMFDKPKIHTLVGGIDGKTQLDLPKMWNI
jgi:hypothetical protein